MASEKLEEEVNADFASKSWQPCQIDGKNFLSKWYDGADACQLIVTDTTKTWFQIMTKQEVEERHRILNPNIEAPYHVILRHVRSLIGGSTSIENDSLHIAHEDEEAMVLNSDTSLKDLPFSWCFNLKQCSRAMIASHLTFPLISMVVEQDCRMQELMKMLIRKDAEIQDYKMSGANLSRKHLETKPFDEITFRKEVLSTKAMLNGCSPAQLLVKQPNVRELYTHRLQTQHLPMKFHQ